jgi:hypothetical protein
MVPTLGRIVHYRSALSGEVFAAIVTRVNENGTVALTVFVPLQPNVPDFGVFTGDVGVNRRDNVAEGDQAGCWSWPPRAA